MKKLLFSFLLIASIVVSNPANCFSQVVESSSDRKAEMILNNPAPNDPETEALFQYFRIKIKYPAELRQQNIQSHIVVFVQVDDMGNSNVKEVIGENQEGFTPQIVALIENYPAKWNESFFGKTVGLPIIFQKHKGPKINPPSLENASYDALLSPITVTGYDTQPTSKPAMPTKY